MSLLRDRFRGAHALLTVAFAVVCVLVVPTVAAAQVDCEDASPIRRLGGVNRFSDTVDSLEKLQAMFASSAEELKKTLADTGWKGNFEDLARAVASGEGVSEASFAPGTKFPWMIFRKYDRDRTPVASGYVCWAGKEDFDAWEIQFTSDGNWYSFVVPVDCGNLTYLAEQPLPKCELSVSQSCESDRWNLSTAGSTGDVAISVKLPDGSTQNLSGTAFTADPNGTYEFEAICSAETPRGTVLKTVARESVTRSCEPPPDPDPPKCTVSVSADTIYVGESVTATVSAMADDPATITAVTINRETVSAPFEKTFAPTSEGTLNVEAMVTDDYDQSAKCSASVNVIPPPQRRGWTLFPFVKSVSLDSDFVHSDLAPDDRRSYAFDGGIGFGATAEYRFNDRIGLPIGFMIAEPDLKFMFDSFTQWGMGDVSTTEWAIASGINFHLTPNSRADFFIGPAIALISHGDATINSIGRTENLDFDDELTFGINLGLDVPFGESSPWGFYLGAMWLAAEAEADSAGREVELSKDPLSVMVGLSYDFGN